jgi:hypothetical protein
VEVIKEMVAEVTKLPHSCERWYSWWNLHPKILRQFLEPGEDLVKKGIGFDCRSLPHPWEEVVVFIQCYFTCEGCYDIIYFQHIRPLDHLCRNWLINMPYFLFKTIKTMEALAQRDKNPREVVSHHDLIKLLVEHALQKEGHS